MTQGLPTDDAARRYLLGNLGEPEQSEIEQQLIEDSGAQERIAVVESELVDDYLGGKLAPRDRARFERRYLTHAEGVRKVDFARLLRRRMIPGRDRMRRDAAAPRMAWLRPWQAAAAAIVLACLAGVLSWEVWQSRRELAVKQAEAAAARARERELGERLRAAEEQLAQDQNEAPSAVPSKPVDGAPRPRSELAFLLTAGTLRDVSAGAQTLALSGASLPLRLELAWPADRALLYRAVIQTPDQVEVWSAEGLAVETRGDSTVLVCRVPAGALTRGDYVLRLYSREGQADWESAADYSFRVTLAD